jgi:hypothetical protein
MPLGSSSEAPVIKPGPRTSRNLGPSGGLIAAGDRETSMFTAVSSWPENLNPCARGFVPGEQREIPPGLLGLTRATETARTGDIN